MKTITVPILMCLFLPAVLFHSAPAHAAEENKQLKINWIEGPKKIDIGDMAEINLPKDYIFANGDDTRKIMELIGNPPNNREQGYVSPSSSKWYLVFEYNDTGYVKDDEKEDLDADAILDSLKEGNESGNAWRKEQNLPPLKIIGWQQKPRYDSVTNNLEWATIAESEGQKVINYNIRYLGRKGVMEIILVGNPDDITAAVKSTKEILKSYDFKKGGRYSEFVEGDKIAEYGLAALVTGGAVAVAAKSGLLAKFWKVIVAGVIGIGALIKKFAGKFFGGKDDSGEIVATHTENRDQNK